jgi:hypothetical protein
MVAMRPYAVHSLIAIGLLLVGVQAHVGFYEPQLFDASGNDWSLEQPFQLPMDASQGTQRLLKTRNVHPCLCH